MLLNRRLCRPLSVLAVLGLSLLLQAACSSTAGSPGPTAAQPSEPQKDYLFQVITPEGRSVGFTADELRQLPLASIKVEGKPEEGPVLLDVLQGAGVEEFKQVTLSGGGSSLTLARQQITPEVILDFANRGTVKLAAPHVPKKDWVKDITEIKVE